MASALEQQRASHRVNRRSWRVPPPSPNDMFLIAAVHQLFVRVESARTQGTPITQQGSAFLTDISESVLRYLSAVECDLEKQDVMVARGRILHGSEELAVLNDKKHEIFYPEGGVEAWLVVFGSWCGLFSSIGMTNIMGTLQTYISTHQLVDYDEAAIGWIFSIYAFLAFFCGVFVGPLFDKYGPRWLVLTGSICVVMDMVLLGFCSRYWHFLLVFGVLGGLGTALMFTPCIAAIGHYFLIGRGNATSIAVSSGAFGGIIFPVMLQQVLPVIGFAWGTRIIACVYLVFCSMANLLVKSRLPPLRGASAKPDFKIFKNPAFAFTVAGVFLLEWALFVPLAYICSYATAQGFSVSMAYDTLIFLNIGSLFGRILPGYIADRIGRYNANILAISLAIICVFGIWLPVGKVTAGLIAFALLFGFASGSNISLAPVCLGELCCTEEYGRYYATCFTAVSFGCLTGIPLAGRIVTVTNGNYWGLIAFTGLCYAAGLAAFTAARVLKTGWNLKAKY